MYNSPMKQPKVAIVHDFLINTGGGEKTVQILCEIFPDAPIYTFIHKPEKMGNWFKNKEIITPNKNTNKIFTIFPLLAKYFTFLMPVAAENFDLSKYDIVISSSSSYSKGVITNPSQLHIGYIHTPPRFLYGYSVESTKRNAWYYKPVVIVVDHFLRIWDYLAAQRPDILTTNSENVKNRIKKFYGRDATVIYPPVEFDFESKKTSKDNLKQPYYLVVSRLAAYKNIDLVIKAFNVLGMKLKIVGTGSEEKKLKRMAKDNIEFLGRIPDKEKHEIMENALGLIFPVEDEDFGIVPIESLAHGVPVLAHKSGGPAETIKEGVDGIFFDKLDLEHFMEKMKEFDAKIHKNEFDKEKMRQHAQKFSKDRFKDEMFKFVMEEWKRHYGNSEKISTSLPGKTG